MSTIQTQVTFVHLESGLAVPSITQRTSFGSQFSANAVEVTTTSEVVNLGDIVLPKQIMVKLVSGDPIRVGLDYGTDGVKYPFRLTDPDESMLLRLNVEGLLEVSTAQTVADVAGSLNDKFFTLADRNGEVKVVITNDGATGITSTGRVVVVTISNDATNAEVASAIVTAFTTDEELSVTAVANLVTFVDRYVGTRTNIADGAAPTGFTVATPSITDPGGVPPVIHLKSTGTSQVVVAVSPH